MIYIENGSTDPAYNLALEEYAFSALAEDVLLLWRSAPCVVCGKFQNAYREVDILEAWRRGAPVLRRESGGGSVYHDLGNVNFSYIGPASPSLDYGRALEPVVEALRRLGAAAERRGPCAIAVGGKKVSGGAQRQSKGRELTHGTLLFDADLAVLNVLTSRPDGERTQSKGVRSQPEAVANMRALLSRDMEAEEFLRALREHLSDPGETVRLDAAQEADVRELAQRKYRDWGWNLGRSPAFTRRREMPPLRYEARDGVITACTLGGAPLPALVGLRLDVAEIEAACRKIADTPAEAEALLRAIF